MLNNSYFYLTVLENIIIAFHFPELRKNYDVDTLRIVLFYALVVAGSLGLLYFVRNKNKRLGTVAWLFVAGAILLGGHRVQVGDFPDDSPYIGLDWFILDLLGSTLNFVFIVSPQIHNWHHAYVEAAIDKNYAAHFSFIDYLLSTAVRGKKNSLIITV